MLKQQSDLTFKNTIKGMSFVIPAYNSEKTIELCIKSILKQDNPSKIEVEILVIDNNSTDKTATLASNLGVQVLLEKKQGRSYARNKGIFSASFDYITFLDSDTILAKDWLKESCNFINKTHFDGYESAVENVPLNKKQNFLDLHRNIFRGGQYNLNDIKSNKFPIINTACCIYKKESLIKLNGFDNILNWFEDADLSKRIFLEGGNLSILPKSKAFCYFTEGYFGYIKRKFKGGRQGIIFLHKWNKNLDSPLKVFINTFKSFSQRLETKEDINFIHILFARVLTTIHLFGHLFARIKRYDVSLYKPKKRITHSSIISKNFNLVLNENSIILRDTHNSKMQKYSKSFSKVFISAIYQKHISPLFYDILFLKEKNYIQDGLEISNTIRAKINNHIYKAIKEIVYLAHETITQHNNEILPSLYLFGSAASKEMIIKDDGTLVSDIDLFLLIQNCLENDFEKIKKEFNEKIEDIVFKHKLPIEVNIVTLKQQESYLKRGDIGSFRKELIYGADIVFPQKKPDDIETAITLNNNLLLLCPPNHEQPELSFYSNIKFLKRLIDYTHRSIWEKTTSYILMLDENIFTKEEINKCLYFLNKQSQHKTSYESSYELFILSFSLLKKYVQDILFKVPSTKRHNSKAIFLTQKYLEILNLYTEKLDNDEKISIRLKEKTKGVFPTSFCKQELSNDKTILVSQLNAMFWDLFKKQSKTSQKIKFKAQEILIEIDLFGELLEQQRLGLHEFIKQYFQQISSIQISKKLPQESELYKSFETYSKEYNIPIIYPSSSFFQ